jgi:hypothetical protein
VIQGHHFENHLCLSEFTFGRQGEDGCPQVIPAEPEKADQPQEVQETRLRGAEGVSLLNGSAEGQGPSSFRDRRVLESREVTSYRVTIRLRGREVAWWESSLL